MQQECSAKRPWEANGHIRCEVLLFVFWYITVILKLVLFHRSNPIVKNQNDNVWCHMHPSWHSRKYYARIWSYWVPPGWKIVFRWWELCNIRMCANKGLFRSRIFITCGTDCRADSSCFGWSQGQRRGRFGLKMPLLLLLFSFSTTVICFITLMY